MRRRTLQQALELAKKLMFDNGLLDPKEWSVIVNFNFKSSYGVCDYLMRRIELSPRIAVYATPFHLEQLILHEIAHALTDCNGHTPEFRKVCREIGCETIYHNFKWNMDYCFNNKPIRCRTREDFKL